MGDAAGRRSRSTSAPTTSRARSCARTIFHAAGATTDDRAEDRASSSRVSRRPRAASRCSATPSTTSSGARSGPGLSHDPARPHLVRRTWRRSSTAPRAPRSRRSRASRPTLNRRLLAGEIDVAPISSIEYARNADTLRLLPRLCVSSEGAVDSIQLVTRVPLERVRAVAVTPESATSVVLTKVLLPQRRARAARRGGRREAADRRRGAAERRSRTRRRTTTSAASGSSGPGCRWCSPSGRPPSRSPPGLAELEDALVASLRARARRAGAARLRGQRALRLPGRLPRPLLREAALPLRAARARGPLHVPRAGARRRRARPRARAALRPARRR